MGPSSIDRQRVPVHIACLPNGGHSTAAALATVDAALGLGVRWLTICTLAAEDWQRPAATVHDLITAHEGLLAQLASRPVRIGVAGRTDWRMPRRLLRLLGGAVRQSAPGAPLRLTLACNYGGRAELVDAVRALVAERVPPEDIDEKALTAHLYEPGMPDPDLVISAGGGQRVSEVLLWEQAYSELVVTDVAWAEFREADLLAAVAEYQHRDRRFGGVRS